MCEITKYLGVFYTSPQNMQNNALFSWKIYTAGKNFTRGGRDKFQVCQNAENGPKIHFLPKKKQSVFCYRIPDFVNDRLPVTALALAARIHFGLCALRAVWITLSYCSRKSFCKFYNSRCRWGLQIGFWLSHLTTFTITFSWRLRLGWFPNYVDFSDLWTFLTGQRAPRF